VNTEKFFRCSAFASVANYSKRDLKSSHIFNCHLDSRCFGYFSEKDCGLDEKESHGTSLFRSVRRWERQAPVLLTIYGSSESFVVKKVRRQSPLTTLSVLVYQALDLLNCFLNQEDDND